MPLFKLVDVLGISHIDWQIGKSTQNLAFRSHSDKGWPSQVSWETFGSSSAGRICFGLLILSLQEHTRNVGGERVGTGDPNTVQSRMAILNANAVASCLQSVSLLLV